MSELVSAFLSENGLTEEKFQKILDEVTKYNVNLRNMFLQKNMNWKICGPKVLSRILDIYDNSTVDIDTGHIIEVNFDY